MDDLQRDQITNRLKSWVNTRPVVRLAPSERSADFLARTFKVCNNLVQQMQSFCNGRDRKHSYDLSNPFGTEMAQQVLSWWTGKLEICPSKIGSSAVAFLYHSAIFAEMAWSGGGISFLINRTFLAIRMVFNRAIKIPSAGSPSNNWRVVEEM